MGYLSKRKTENRKHLAVWCFAVAVFLLSTADFFLINGKITDNLADCRVQMLFTSALAFIFSITNLNFRTALISVLAFLINFCEIASRSDLFREIPDPIEIWAKPIVKKIAVIDIGGEKSSYVKMLAWIKEKSPDYTVIINAVDTDFLKKLSEYYNYSVIGKKLALFTNDEYIDADWDKKNNDMLWAKFISPNDRQYAILAVNMPKTDDADDYKRYLQRCGEIASFSNSFDEPVILAGGFKTAPWTDKTRCFASVSFKTGVFYGNYPAYLPGIMRYPADYIYTHNGIDILSQQTQKSNGSRYLPVLATVSIHPI